MPASSGPARRPAPAPAPVEEDIAASDLPDIADMEDPVADLPEEESYPEQWSEEDTAAQFDDFAEHDGGEDFGDIEDGEDALQAAGGDSGFDEMPTPDWPRRRMTPPFPAGPIPTRSR